MVRFANVQPQPPCGIHVKGSTDWVQDTDKKHRPTRKSAAKDEGSDTPIYCSPFLRPCVIHFIFNSHFVAERQSVTAED